MDIGAWSRACCSASAALGLRGWHSQLVSQRIRDDIGVVWPLGALLSILCFELCAVDLRSCNRLQIAIQRRRSYPSGARISFCNSDDGQIVFCQLSMLEHDGCFRKVFGRLQLACGD